MFSFVQKQLHNDCPHPPYVIRICLLSETLGIACRVDSKLSLPCHHVAILKPLFLREGHLSLPVTVYSSGNRCLVPYALSLPFIYLFYCVRLMASLYKLSYSLHRVCSSSAWQLSAGPGRCLSREEWRELLLLMLTVVLSGSVFIMCSPQRWICLEKWLQGLFNGTDDALKDVCELSGSFLII